MSAPSLWQRLRHARIVQVLLVYLGASWAVLQIAQVLAESLSLPEWVMPVAILLLLVGLVIILATAWVQSLPSTTAAEEAGERPTDWEVAPADALASLKEGRLPHLTWGRAILGGVVALCLLFGGAGLYVVATGGRGILGPTEAGAGEAPAGIAVMPFTVTGDAELDLWKEGMVDVLSTNLDGMAGFRTIDSRTVMARWREEVSGDASPDLSTSLEVAGKTGARLGLVGGLVGGPRGIRMSAEVYDLSNGKKVVQAVEEGPADSVLSMVGRLSVDLTRDLLTKTGQDVIAVPRVAGLTTTSLPALRAYLEGEAAFRKADFAGAVAAYERAVDMDSTFALGWARLAGSYGWLENVSSRQMARAAERATTLLDQLPARQRIIVDANRAMSERDLSIEGPLRAAVQQYPDDPDLWYLLGDFFRHFGEDAGLASWEEDLDAFRHAVALDPTFAPYYIHLIEGEIGAGDTAAAKAALEAYQEASSGQDPEPYIPVAFRIYLGSPAERQAALAGLDSLSERDLFQMANSVGWDGLPDPAWQREVALKAIALHHQGVWLNRLLELDLRAGRIHLAGEDLSAPDESDYYRMQHAVSFQTLAISLAPEYLALARDPEVCGTRLDAGAGCMLAMGMAAAERGDRKEWRRWMERNDSLDRLYRSQNAPGHGEEHRLIARAIEGWWADRQEHDVDKARALLAEASDLPAFAGPVRWRLAELLAESRPARALEMFRRMSGAYLPYAQVRVGKIQEALGDTASARAAYRKAADLLVDADPDLLWAQEARDGVTRLGG